ncbi:NAD(P)-dependent oxidoreductase [Streptomyces yaizuensis]|uniref:NAD(P)-dependent oxidoreductase n=1 Tax=Streptomyces yaizuensis TaxID=2989713 RepID=A0ABQ5P963_9ACTN|nr:NAD(P)-dependent oxidoreductase [Streptomyces sp. YSPA8]GLF99102.1 NAD(P)-dependent oxidoreductase [Streptomyces sp. YSPA8]
MTERLTVAVLGTGVMGAAMARNLARSGHAVRAWNRTRAKAEGLVADGVDVAATPADAVRDADVVLTVLHDGPAVLDVVREAAPALRSGAVWAQSTTVGVDDVPELAGLAREHGLVFFDAPVLGTREPAEAGQLQILAAGPAGDRASVTPVFDAIGSRTVWTGEDGAAGTSTRLKLVVNSWVLTATNAAGEILALAGALGVDPEGFFDLIAGGPLDMGYLRLKADLVRDGRLTPASFAVATAAKDARLISEAGRRYGVRLDLADAGAARMERAAAQGHGREDMAAAYYASFPEETDTGDRPTSP